jgi:hypothetical protein
LIDLMLKPQHPAPGTPALTFEAGCQWLGTFVKRAFCQNRGVSFHLPLQIVVNCLPANPQDAGPIGTVEANDPTIEAACIKAFARAGLGTTIILAVEDFAA